MKDTLKLILIACAMHAPLFAALAPEAVRGSECKSDIELANKKSHDTATSTVGPTRTEVLPAEAFQPQLAIKTPSPITIELTTPAQNASSTSSKQKAPQVRSSSYCDHPTTRTRCSNITKIWMSVAALTTVGIIAGVSLLKASSSPSAVTPPDRPLFHYRVNVTGCGAAYDSLYSERLCTEPSGQTMQTLQKGAQYICDGVSEDYYRITPPLGEPATFQVISEPAGNSSCQDTETELAFPPLYWNDPDYEWPKGPFAQQIASYYPASVSTQYNHVGRDLTNRCIRALFAIPNNWCSPTPCPQTVYSEINCPVPGIGDTQEMVKLICDTELNGTSPCPLPTQNGGAYETPFPWIRVIPCKAYKGHFPLFARNAKPNWKCSPDAIMRKAREVKNNLYTRPQDANPISPVTKVAALVKHRKATKPDRNWRRKIIARNKHT